MDASRGERLVRALESECGELRVELASARDESRRLGRLLGDRQREHERCERELVRVRECAAAELAECRQRWAEQVGMLGDDWQRASDELRVARADRERFVRAVSSLARELAFGEQRFERLAELVLDSVLGEDELDSLLNGPADGSYGRRRYPGKYEAAGVPELAEGLDSMLGSGYEDESAGSTDRLGHAARVGRAIVYSDSQGFVTYELLDSDELARERFELVRAELDPECECGSDDCECDS